MKNVWAEHGMGALPFNVKIYARVLHFIRAGMYNKSCFIQKSEG